MAATAPPEFSAKEKVLCYHGPLMYEAKVLKVETFTLETSKNGGEGVHYFVHYKGWKQTWDEWVPPSRLLKFTEQNIILQKSLQSQYASTAASTGPSKTKAARGDGTAASTSTRVGGRKTDTRGTKRSRDDDDGPSNKKQDMRLTVPELLKVILVDDWEAVTKNTQLVKLPRSPTVLEILDDFSKHAQSSPKTVLREPALLTPTVVSGLQVYFDRSLGQNLLYRFERPQYAEIRKKYITGQHAPDGPEKRMSEVYGAEHLLRMLVAMPQMMAPANMDPESIGIVRDYVNELLIFLVDNKDRLFLSEYETATPQYQNISRT